MISRITADQVKALGRLGRTPDGQVLIAILNESLEHTKNLLVEAQQESFAAVQGQAKSLKELCDLFNRAEQVISSKGSS